MKKSKHVFLLLITGISAMGGLLFGYDWVVIGGAKPFYESYFQINDSPSLQGWAMSSALIGCLMGAIVSGYLTDRIGRKLPLIISAILFSIAAIGTGAVSSFSWFVIFRLIGGLGIGLASALSPVYIAEIAPAHLRGRLVSINQLTIVIGILAAQIINYFIADKVPEGATNEFILSSWNGQTGWRWMFWAGAVPALLFLGLSFILPESPRYLLKIGNEIKAKSVLRKLIGEQQSTHEMKEIINSLQGPSSKIEWKELRSARIKPLLIIGIVLAVFQQWCGINVIFNYAEEIFTSAGYTVGEMLFNIVITGSVNLVFTIIAMRMVDSWGRRKLMLLGSAGLSIVYLFLGLSYYLELQGIVVLIFVLIAIAVYAMTLAPVTWVILSEIFPNKVRGAAMSIATTSLWIACFILTYTFPLLNNTLKASGTFWLYAFICLSGLLFIYTRLPETKGKSLEEIEKGYGK
jgi:sugar porter (SP) family MFS transporter